MASMRGVRVKVFGFDHEQAAGVRTLHKDGLSTNK